MQHPLRLVCLAAALAVRLPAQAPAPVPVPSELAQLDFWVGDWDVFLASGPKDGTNRIGKMLGGYVLLENWSELDAHEGKSWFYFYRPEKRWKQVWITDTGGAKEKAQVADAPAGSVRFRGEIPLRDGRKLLDQTTLTPLPDGRVRQVIEQSRDGGATWQVAYDAFYVRQTAQP